jgi:hypothetical protein
MAAPRTLTLAPGFSPNPTTLTVTAGGPVAVSPLCAGNFPTEPNIVLSTTAPLELRVQTRSAADTTLQIRFSDGRVLCNDDAVARNAMLHTSFPAGRHEIFVGIFMLRSTASAEVDIVDDTRWTSLEPRMRRCLQRACRWQLVARPSDSLIVSAGDALTAPSLVSATRRWSTPGLRIQTSLPASDSLAATRYA